MKKFALKINLILCFLLVPLVLTGCQGREIVITKGFNRNEVMRINTSSCYLNEMMLYLTTMQNQYEAIYGEEIWEKEEDGLTMEDKLKDNVLAKISQVKVMNLMAEEYGLTLSDEENEEIAEISKEFYASLNDRERELLDVTEEDINRFYSEYVLSGKVYDYVIKDINPEISDDEARTITVQHILVKTYAYDSSGNRIEYTERAKEEALEKINMVHELALTEGTSFEALQATYNEDTVGTYTFGRGEMASEFEKVAFSLDKDEISDVFETEYGYHIIKCISDFDVDETQKNKVKILEERKEEVFNDTYNTFVESLTKNLNKELYDSISLIHDPEVTTSTFFDVEF